MSAQIPNVLDPAQLTRIEAVHRGFLYQHLYAAGCLLSASQLNADTIAVELDEDIEVRTPAETTYIQVKTRNDNLIPSDLVGVLERFDNIRVAHAKGERPGYAHFAIVANAEAGPKLSKELSTWPPDVELITPSRGPGRSGLPPATKNLNDALEWASKAASAVPLTLLAPDTLVWKLASIVQFAAAGTKPGEPHAIRVAELPNLFEQLLMQLQHFPAPPATYRPQTDEPALITGERIRFIVGHSGAGKTSWASQASLHASGDVFYFDADQTIGPALANGLVREIAAATYQDDKSSLGMILIPGANGLEMLGLLDGALARDMRSPLIVIDNAHQIGHEHYEAIFNRAKAARFLLLGRPGETAATLTAAAVTKEEVLKGWSDDEIAAEGSARGCAVTAQSASTLHSLTGGLPLYVQSALHLAGSRHSGNLASFCLELEAQTHLEKTAQELILGAVYDALKDDERAFVATLAIAGVPLSLDEARRLCKGIDASVGSRLPNIIRALRAQGVVQVFGDQRIKVHDAFGVLGRAHFSDVLEVSDKAVLRELRQVLVESLHKARDLTRFTRFVVLSAELGEIRTLIDLATDELFHELGLSRDLWAVLESAAVSDSVSDEEQFLALDGLLFSDLKHGEHEDILQSRIDLMEGLIRKGTLSDYEQATLSMKKMSVAAQKNDHNGMIAAYQEGENLVSHDDQIFRIFQYNAARALYKFGAYEGAGEIATSVRDEYFEIFDLDMKKLFGMNGQGLQQHLATVDHSIDDVKHLADTLDLLACCLSGALAALTRVQALKFYQVAHAPDSYVRVAQDICDNFLIAGDYQGARQTFEQHVFPALQEYGLPGRAILARAHYAVTLAHCGDHNQAAQEVDRILPYRDGLEDIGRQELDRQVAIVRQLQKDGAPPAFDPFAQMSFSGIGRNERCPCGSGKKFKRCHGSVA